MKKTNASPADLWVTLKLLHKPASKDFQFSEVRRSVYSSVGAAIRFKYGKIVDEIV